MQKVFIAPHVTFAERFFVERSLELLNNATIDTYRLRIHNPKSILIEASQVIKATKEKRYRHDEYAKEIIEEVLAITKTNSLLNFSSVHAEYFFSFLKDKNNIYDKCHLINVVLKDNENYSQILFDKILSEITRLNGLGEAVPLSELTAFDTYIGYYFVECKKSGYSKEFLHKLILGIFSSTGVDNFGERILKMKEALSGEKKKCKVIIGIDASDNFKNKVEVISSEFKKLLPNKITRIKEKANSKVSDFFNDKYDYYQIELKVVDYFSAANIARLKLQKVIDLLYIGLNSNYLNIKQNCVVIGKNAVAHATLQKLNIDLEGYIRSNQSDYSSFVEKISNIDTKSVEKETLDKLYSGLRYLRLANEVKELEGKLLNLWIAIEYLFSTDVAGEEKVKRMREIFPKLNSLTYGRRLLNDLHKNIKRLGLEAVLDHYDDNLEYLFEDATYTTLDGLRVNSSLLAFRAFQVKEGILDRKKFVNKISKHQTNLKWNIRRIYRVRNEIVHSASENNDILEITSHLRYYLVFIINGLIDFLLNTPFDVDMDRKISVQDYFSVQAILSANLYFEKEFEPKDVLAIRNFDQYLS